MTATFDDWEREYNARMDAAVAALDPRWGVRAYKAHRTRDGVAYVFTLTDGGKPVAWAEDSGRGGGPRLDWDNRTGPSAEAFTAEARRLLPDGLSVEALIEAVLQRSAK